MGGSVTSLRTKVTSVVAMVVLSAGAFSVAQTANAVVTKCQAQNITLGTKESPNLQALINAASPGNTIQVKGVCVGPFTISKNLTVFGKPTKAVPHPALDGGYDATTNPSPGPVVRVGAGTTVAIRDLTIQHGAYPCTETNQTLECDTGAIFNAGALALTRVTVADNIGTGIGNYEVSGAASLSLTDSLVTRNHAQFHGGGILTISGTVTLTRTTVRDNQADLDAGGISVAIGAVSVTLNDSEVSHNAAGDQGGGIWNGADLIVNGTTTIEHNAAATDGGGIFNFKGTLGNFAFDGDVDLNGASEVRDNTASGSGGGVYSTGALSLNDDATVHDNASATTGGGIFNDCTTGVLEGATTTGTDPNVYDNTPDQVNVCA
jgi:predicted outer membrane repeat protein